MRMAPELPGRETAIRTLVAALDDAVLARSVPGQAPAAVRRLLTGEPVPPAPAKVPAAPAAAEAPRSIGRCRLFTDGASRGNPGEAGAGAVVCDPAGGELAARSAYLGQCTNNVAEYRALLLGLDEARRLGCRELDISLDSELIVRQLQGRYKVKHEALLHPVPRGAGPAGRFRPMDRGPCAASQERPRRRVGQPRHRRKEDTIEPGLHREADSLRGECMVAPASAGEESPNTTGHGGS